MSTNELHPGREWGEQRLDASADPEGPELGLSPCLQRCLPGKLPTSPAGPSVGAQGPWCPFLCEGGAGWGASLRGVYTLE